jgi:hypothetical protein
VGISGTAPFDRSGTSAWAGKADLADCTRSTIAGQTAHTGGARPEAAVPL